MPGISQVSKTVLPHSSSSESRNLVKSQRKSFTQKQIHQDIIYKSCKIKNSNKSNRQVIKLCYYHPMDYSETKKNDSYDEKYKRKFTEKAVKISTYKRTVKLQLKQNPCTEIKRDMKCKKILTDVCI